MDRVNFCHQYGKEFLFCVLLAIALVIIDDAILINFNLNPIFEMQLTTLITDIIKDWVL